MGGDFHEFRGFAGIEIGGDLDRGREMVDTMMGTAMIRGTGEN
jgi:hypothetical protein